MDQSSVSWRLIREESWDGPMNMALDEVAAETAGSQGLCTIRVYRWCPSTLSLGYHQACNTVNWEVCKEEGITVTRRPTGGGGIYHDEVGDISYSIVVPSSVVSSNLVESYRALLAPVQTAFAELSVPVSYVSESKPAIYEPACYLRGLNPAHDLVVGGRKISGNAQYRQKDAVIQHGSVCYQSVPERHLSVFTTSNVSVDAFTERVTSIREEGGGSRSTAVEVLERVLGDWSGAETGEWTDCETRRAQTLVTEKYASEDWTKHRSSK